jgi:hypothetical protein
MADLAVVAMTHSIENLYHDFDDIQRVQGRARVLRCLEIVLKCFLAALKLDEGTRGAAAFVSVEPMIEGPDNVFTGRARFGNFFQRPDLRRDGIRGIVEDFDSKSLTLDNCNPC